MTTTKKEGLLRKIKNLLDLADDKQSKHEAEAAAKKAQALIMKYNIEEAELRDGEEAEISDELYPVYDLKSSGEGTWLRDLFHAVAKFNFCKIVISKQYVDGKRREHFYILGEADNVELVKMLCEQLTYTIRSLERDAWQEYNGTDSRGVFLRSFLKGAASGVYSQLSQQWDQQAENSDESTAIIVTKKNEAVEQYSKEKFGELGKARNGSSSSRTGFAEGRKAGKNVNVNAGLRGQGGSKMISD